MLYERGKFLIHGVWVDALEFYAIPSHMAKRPEQEVLNYIMSVRDSKLPKLPPLHPHSYTVDPEFGVTEDVKKVVRRRY
jgi:hypothetical protein